MTDRHLYWMSPSRVFSTVHSSSRKRTAAAYAFWTICCTWTNWPEHRKKRHSLTLTHHRHPKWHQRRVPRTHLKCRILTIWNNINANNYRENLTKRKQSRAVNKTRHSKGKSPSDFVNENNITFVRNFLFVNIFIYSYFIYFSTSSFCEQTAMPEYYLLF